MYDFVKDNLYTNPNRILKHIDNEIEFGNVICLVLCISSDIIESSDEEYCIEQKRILDLPSNVLKVLSSDKITINIGILHNNNALFYIRTNAKELFSHIDLVYINERLLIYKFYEALSNLSPKNTDYWKKSFEYQLLLSNNFEDIMYKKPLFFCEFKLIIETLKLFDIKDINMIENFIINGV